MKTLNDLLGNLPLPAFLAGRLDEIQVSDYQVTTDAAGVTASLELAFTNGLLAFEFFSFTVQMARVENVSVSIREEPVASMSFPDLEVSLSGFFRPAERVDGTWIIHGNGVQKLAIHGESIALRASLFAGISIADAGQGGAFGLPALSLPPTALGKTGIILEINQLTPVLNSRQVTQPIRDLGFNAGFKGIFAESATIYWLPQIQLSHLIQPGLQVELQQLALGNEGISFDAGMDWPVSFDDSGNFVVGETEMLGYLFGEAWALAIENVSGRLRKNIPESFAVSSYLRLPFFEAVFSAAFSLSYRLNEDQTTYQTALALEKATADPIQVSYLANNFSFTLNSFNASGFLSNAGFGINGQAGFAAAIYGFEWSVGNSAFSYTHDAERDAFDFQLTNVVLGELGQADQARLVFEADRDAEGGFHFHKLLITAEYAWQDVKGLIPPDLQDKVDLPDDGRIEAIISWVETETSTHVVVDLKTEVSHLDNLWQFIPEAYRPVVRQLRSMFRLTYESVEAFHSGASADGDLTVELSAAMELGIPEISQHQLPGFDLIQWQAGDEEGFVNALFKAQYQSQQSGDHFNAGLTIENPIAVDLFLPGTVAGQPFIQTALTRMGLQFEAGEDDDGEGQIGGQLLFEGDFTFRPLAPLNFPFAAHFNALMHRVGLDEILGKTSLRLAFTEDDFDLAFQGAFEGLGIDIDVFDLLSALAPDTGSISGNEIDVDFDIGFQLVGFTLNLGTDNDDGSNDDFYFSFQLDVVCTMTGLPPVRAAITLSDEEFSFGIEDLAIPIGIPRYPIDVEDLNRLIHDNGVWSLADGTPGQTYLTELEGRETTLSAQLDAPGVGDADRFRLTKDLAFLELKRLMIQLAMAIHGRVQVGGDDSAKVYQGLVTADTWLHSMVLNFLHFDTNLKLHFPEIKFKIPFNNPRGIALAGTGRLVGFSEEDPLKGLEDYTFSLGLSTQYIFAQIESTGDPIPIPAFGTRYDDGAVSISKFMIGYGYTKNGFAFDFAGECILPTQLIEDADSSAELGFGIKLPRYNKLAFKIEVMVLTIGKVTVAIPLPQFDLDLRTPSAPALVSTQRCDPYWDGLELIVRDVFHTDLKHLAFSPFFGMNIMPNLKYDGDLKLGDNKNGLTLIFNDLLMLLGQATTNSIIPIPFFADPYQPYFSNICANLRLLGFELNFNLERPFPSPSPMALLEVFGLISNPMMEIDPHGSLANTVRFSLTDGHIKAPDYLLRLFPDAAGLVNKRYEFTLNLGTLIAMTQSVMKGVQPALDQTRSFLEDSSQTLETWKDNIPNSFNPWDFVTLLPPELRVFKLEGGMLGGFQASACIVLTTGEEAREALALKDSLPDNASGPAAIQPGRSFTTYEKFSAPKYKPTSGHDFANSWTGEGSAGSWDYAEKVITQSAEFDGVSFFLYQKDVPDKVHISGRILTSDHREGAYCGWVFDYTDVDNYYLLKTFREEGEAPKVVLLKRENGAFADQPLIDKTLYGNLSDAIELELVSYLEDLKKVFVVRSSQTEIGRARDQQPLANGKLGLYAENGAIVRFSEMVAFELKLTHHHFGEVDGTDFQVNLSLPPVGNRPVAGGKSTFALFKREEFDGFGEEHLDLIPDGKLRAEDIAMGSLFMGARLTILEGFGVQFFGKVYQNGAFALVSEAESRPLELSVMNFQTKVPFAGYGTLQAVGWPTGNGYEGYVEALGYFTWSPFPEVEIAMGSAGDPISLQLREQGRFRLLANATISLFQDAATIKGLVDMANNHCKFSGKLKYQAGDLIALDVMGEGGLSPRPRFWFEGMGKVALFGKPVADTEVIFEKNRASFSLLLAGQDLPHFNFLDPSFDIELQLQGRVDMRHKSRPAFEFSGGGRLAALGANLEGEGGVRRVVGNRPEDDFSEMYLGGRLFWQGREWWQGRMNVHSKEGVQLAGFTQFGLMLSPGNVGGVEVANLFLNMSLGGSMKVSRQGAFQFHMDLVWTLGVSLPGNERQLLPLASDEVRLEGALNNPVNLINLNGFRLFPVEGFNLSLPVPEIKGKGDPVLLIGAKNGKVALNVPQLGTIYFDEKSFVTGLQGGTLPSLSPGSLPSLNAGSLPSLSSGSLPSLSAGSRPSLSINFLNGTFSFNRGTLPSLNKGTLPSLNKGSLPSLNKGTLPSLSKGSFPKLKETSIPIPAFKTSQQFDSGSKPQAVHGQYEVKWDQRNIPIEFAAFKSSAIQLGFDKNKRAFYIRLGNKKYGLDGVLWGGR